MTEPRPVASDILTVERRVEETRVWEGTERKDEASKAWCVRTSERTGRSWWSARIKQAEFEPHHPPIRFCRVLVSVTASARVPGSRGRRRRGSKLHVMERA